MYIAIDNQKIKFCETTPIVMYSVTPVTDIRILKNEGTP